jgi:sec-independent protein translocase protein TatC
MGHLLELRWRIFVSLFFIVVSTGASWVFWRELSVVITTPVKEYNESAPEEARVELITTAPMEAFVAVLHLGLWGGLVLAFPLIGWQTWRFVGPGLYRREKLALLPVLTLGTGCFAGGAYFAYRLVLPIALQYLLSFGPEMGVEQKLALREYMSFFLMLHVSFGLAFETPLVILALARLGVVTARGLVRALRYVIVAAFVIGAVLTPPDALTQAMLAGSLVALYVLSIFLAAVFGRKPPADDEPGGAPPAEGPTA